MAKRVEVDVAEQTIGRGLSQVACFAGGLMAYQTRGENLRSGVGDCLTAAYSPEELRLLELCREPVLNSKQDVAELNTESALRIACGVLLPDGTTIREPNYLFHQWSSMRINRWSSTDYRPSILATM